MSDDTQATLRDFKQAVNMTAGEIETWLATDDSQAVGQKPDETGESLGHESGRHIVALLHKNPGDYGEDDLNQMKRVVSYVHRHLAQRPGGDISDTRWRYSLLNWGHDPLKK